MTPIEKVASAILHVSAGYRRDALPDLDAGGALAHVRPR